MFEYEERAVAFIDVLGFKSLVNKSVSNNDSHNELAKLVELLTSAVPILDKKVKSSVPNRLTPKHNYISDCIILSAPLNDDEYKYYNGLDAIIMRVIQLTHFFLKHGYLIRGGISVGKLWHSENNIVGPAYQEAYQLEDNGNEPIVVLSESAAQLSRYGTRMSLNKDEKIFVNGINEWYIPENSRYGVISDTYTEYLKLTKKMISQNSLPKRVKDKWLWFKNYIEMESGDGQKWPSA